MKEDFNDQEKETLSLEECLERMNLNDSIRLFYLDQEDWDKWIQDHSGKGRIFKEGTSIEDLYHLDMEQLSRLYFDLPTLLMILFFHRHEEYKKTMELSNSFKQYESKSKYALDKVNAVRMEIPLNNKMCGEIKYIDASDSAKLDQWLKEKALKGGPIKNCHSIEDLYSLTLQDLVEISSDPFSLYELWSILESDYLYHLKEKHKKEQAYFELCRKGDEIASKIYQADIEGQKEEFEAYLQGTRNSFKF